jgi:hypothetical protein
MRWSLTRLILVQHGRMRSESSRLANMMALGRANESSRVAELIRRNTECMVAEALAKAARISQRNCTDCVKLDLSGGFIGNTINSPVPSSSSNLQSKQRTCILNGTYVVGPPPAMPESMRVANMEQRTIDLSTDPTNPDSRFSAYRRPFIQVCPAIPQSYYTAGQPVMQGTRCGLPNKPDNPVLPG